MELECQYAWNDFNGAGQWCEGHTERAEAALCRIHEACQPTHPEWAARDAAVRRISDVLDSMPDFQPDPRSRHANGSGSRCLAQLYVFGSFCSGLYHKGSDLDLAITGQWRNRPGGALLDMATMSQRDTVDMLHRIRRVLLASGVASDAPSGFQTPCQVINARVPLVMFTDAATGTQVDISVCNHAGCFKSRFTRNLAQLDARFGQLFRLVKLWAEVHGLNDPKAGTLNSWSLTQMVIFHLQQCSPPLLPPLCYLFHPEWAMLDLDLTQMPRLLEDGSGMPVSQQARNAGGASLQQAGRTAAPYKLLRVCEQQCAERRGSLPPLREPEQGPPQLGEPDSSSLLNLLASFFVRFTEVLTQWIVAGEHRDERMSTWVGGWIVSPQPWRQDYLVAFEDPFDASDNTARTLGTPARNDGGARALLAELQSAATACLRLRSEEDVDRLMLTLFDADSSELAQPGFDPIQALVAKQHAAAVAAAERLHEERAAREAAEHWRGPEPLDGEELRYGSSPHSYGSSPGLQQVLYGSSPQLDRGGRGRGSNSRPRSGGHQQQQQQHHQQQHHHQRQRQQHRRQRGQPPDSQAQEELAFAFTALGV